MPPAVVADPARALLVRRIAAFTFDRAAIVIVVGAADLVADLLQGTPLAALGRFVLVLGFLVAIAYAYARDAIDGASLGRRLFNLQVVTRDGRLPIGILGSMKREVLLHFVPFVFIEIFLVLAGKPRLGDRWAKTLVVEREWRPKTSP